MSEALNLPREFQPIDDYREVIGYLSEGSKTHASTMIWTKDQDHVIQSYVTQLSQVDRTFYTRTPKDFDLKALIAALKKSGTTECFFSISLQSANLFFKTKFRDQVQSELKFDTPVSAYKVQRRANVRFQIPTGHLLWVEFQDPLFPESTIKKKVIDISAGGLGFAASEQDEALFVPGLTLQSMKLTIRSKLMDLEAEVRHKKVLSDATTERHTKIGVQFKNLTPADSQLIAGYVFEESRKYFMRLL